MAHTHTVCVDRAVHGRGSLAQPACHSVVGRQAPSCPRGGGAVARRRGALRDPLLWHSWRQISGWRCQGALRHAVGARPAGVRRCRVLRFRLPFLLCAVMLRMPRHEAHPLVCFSPCCTHSATDTAHGLGLDSVSRFCGPPSPALSTELAVRSRSRLGRSPRGPSLKNCPSYVACLCMRVGGRYAWPGAPPARRDACQSTHPHPSCCESAPAATPHARPAGGATRGNAR